MLGTVDALVLFLPGGALAFAFVTGGGGAVFLVCLAVALGLAPTVLALGYWLARALRGARAARRGQGTMLASDGSGGWRAVSVVVATVNLLATGVFVVVAASGAFEAPRAWIAGVTTACNVWVALYYRSRRRWDGARVWGSGARPVTSS